MGIVLFLSSKLCMVNRYQGTKLHVESNTLSYRGLHMVQLREMSDYEQQSSKCMTDT
jgi:hypothetical protein